MATPWPVTDAVLEGRETGEEVSIHVPHGRPDVHQRKVVVSEASVPHELVLRRNSGEAHAAKVAVGGLLGGSGRSLRGTGTRPGPAPSDALCCSDSRKAPDEGRCRRRCTFPPAPSKFSVRF